MSEPYPHDREYEPNFAGPDEHCILLYRSEYDRGGWPRYCTRNIDDAYPKHYTRIWLGPEGSVLTYQWYEILESDQLISANLADWLIDNRESLIERNGLDQDAYAITAFDAIIVFLTGRANGLTGETLHDQSIQARHREEPFQSMGEAAEQAYVSLQEQIAQLSEQPSQSQQPDRRASGSRDRSGNHRASS